MEKQVPLAGASVPGSVQRGTASGYATPTHATRSTRTG